MEQDIYDAAYRLPWQTWFTPRRTIKIKVSAQHCPLKSLDFVTLRIKDAVCDRMRLSAGGRPDIDTKNPDILIAAFLDRERCTFYLDTSGDPLFKRGWRKNAAEAPLKENLAAGILRLAGWPKEMTLFDPMCGAGTFAIEAALMAQRIAPGINRRFAFEKFQHFNERIWRSLRDSSRVRQLSTCPVSILASDCDKQILDAAAANLQAAGVASSVRLAQGDLLDQPAPSEIGMLLTNPPYGLRVGTESELAAMYPRIGDWLKQRFTGWTAYFFTADTRFPTLLRLSPSRRVPLFNGAIECRLYEFHVVSGSMRHTRRAGKNPLST
jgi:putative N6-adenine-specific DNA methylase